MNCEHAKAKLSRDRMHFYCADCGIELQREYAEALPFAQPITCEGCCRIYEHGSSDASARFDFCSQVCEDRWRSAKPSGYCYEGRHSECKHESCDCICHPPIYMM